MAKTWRRAIQKYGSFSFEKAFCRLTKSSKWTQNDDFDVKLETCHFLSLTVELLKFYKHLAQIKVYYVCFTSLVVIITAIILLFSFKISSGRTRVYHKESS
jgi:uncharacterized oligopeptide transporter (OPT) family protein